MILIFRNLNEINTATGSSGAGRIPYAILQVLHYLLDYNTPLEQAVNWPRLHWHDGILNLEPGFQFQRSRLEVESRVEEWQNQSLFYGGANTVQRQGDRFIAAPDHRRDGVTRVKNP